MSEDSENDTSEKDDSQPNETVSDCEAELSELKRQHLYLRADFDNYRKQAIKERADLIKYGSEPILRELLGVLDNLELASHAELKPETLEQYKNGVEMIANQFKKTLERFGVEEVPTEGQTFDPSLHEALSSVNDPELPFQVIAQTFKKPYKLHGKVIRPGQVVVNTATGKKKDEKDH